MNVALFPNAEVIDFWARYRDDLWLDHGGDGWSMTPHAQLWLTPGHSEEDASLIVDAEDGVYAMTHLWWRTDRTPVIDPYCLGPRRCSTSTASASSPLPTSSSRATASRSATR